MRDNDIVLFYNGSHYNALSWKSPSDDEYEEAARAEAHFNDEFGDDERATAAEVTGAPHVASLYISRTANCAVSRISEYGDIKVQIYTIKLKK